MAPDAVRPERAGYGDVVREGRLRDAVARLNPSIPPDAREQAVKAVLRSTLEASASAELLAVNERFHRLLTDGVEVEYQRDGRIRGDKVWLVGFDDPGANDCLVVNQFTVVEDQARKRPDLVLFINGLPLVVMELKNPAAENATVRAAYQQLQTYEHSIPGLLRHRRKGMQGSSAARPSNYTRCRVTNTISIPIPIPIPISIPISMASMKCGLGLAITHILARRIFSHKSGCDRRRINVPCG